jgi:hypothetical protein
MAVEVALEVAVRSSRVRDGNRMAATDISAQAASSFGRILVWHTKREMEENRKMGEEMQKKKEKKKKRKSASDRRSMLRIHLGNGIDSLVFASFW